MGTLDIARLAGYNAAWKATRSRALGWRLIRALGAGDEDVRVVAATFLTRAGEKAEPLLFEALRRRENVPAVLEVLGGIADEAAEHEIRRHLNDPDPAVVKAAAEAERVVNRHRNMTPPRSAASG
jgi:HEAT repeat protein